MEKQVKSKDRVVNFGEVFTAEREVKAMLDLVKEESFKVDSRFLEPACGNGNFLVEILRRKLQTVEEKHSKEYEAFSMLAVGSIYGIDIQKDNCEESVERMMSIIKDHYLKVNSSEPSELYLKNIQFIMETNIINGDGLTGMRVDTGEPIVFSEWEIKDNKVYRVDYEVNEMIKAEKQNTQNKEMSKSGGNLFSLAGAPVEEVKPKVHKKHRAKTLDKFIGE
jgi:hypothetical protein